MKQYLLLPFILFSLFLTGCATVPMASLDADSQAKSFKTTPDKSNIYLYRNETLGSAIGMPVALDGQVAGKTAANTYFFWSVQPGKHEISSITENTAKITLDTQPGKNYYVWQEVKMGMWTARSQLHEVSEEEGQKAVNECKLIASE